MVRAHVAAKKHGLKLLPGAEFFVQASHPFRLVVLPHNAAGWGNLCEFITAAKQAGDLLDKGSYRVALGDSDFSLLADCEVLLVPLPDAIDIEALGVHAIWAAGLFGMQAWLAVELLQAQRVVQALQQLDGQPGIHAKQA